MNLIKIIQCIKLFNKILSKQSKILELLVSHYLWISIYGVVSELDWTNYKKKVQNKT